MKRYTAAAIMGLMLILFAQAAIAAPVDLSIGGTAWYIWWKPAWADAKSSSIVYNAPPGLFNEDSQDFKTSSNLMGGPILSIAFLERWSIQSVFTIGRFRSYSRGLATTAMIDSTPEASFSYKKYSRDIMKWDSDTSIGCAVHKMVKIFAGFKSQGYRYEERLNDYLLQVSPVYIHRVIYDDVKAYGGGLGLGLTIPLGGNFYFMAGVSGVVLWSFERINLNRSKSFFYDSVASLFVFLPVIPQKGRYFSYGGTASLSFAYNIEKINTTLSIGGRYQLLFNRQNFNKYNPLYNDVSMNIIDRQYDHFFGITLSAIYTFHIGKRA